MPLISEGRSKAIPHSELRAVGFWMTVKGQILSSLCAFCAHIEAAASEKFDRLGPDDEKYEGVQTSG